MCYFVLYNTNNVIYGILVAMVILYNKDVLEISTIVIKVAHANDIVYSTDILNKRKGHPV
jgi:hypothetical protein